MFFSHYLQFNLSFLGLCDEIINEIINVVAFEVYILLTYNLTQKENCPSSQDLFVICYSSHVKEQ